MRKIKYRLVIMMLMLLAYMTFCGYKVTYDDSQNKVYDNANLFNKGDIKKLNSECVEAAKEMKMDIVVLTSDDNTSKSTQDYADDFYDDNGFGYDQGQSGILLLIDMQNRQVYISTAGIAIRYFSDEDIDDVLCDLDDYMADEDYFAAAETFVSSVQYHVDNFNADDYSEVKDWYESDYTDYSEFYDENVSAVRYAKNPFVCLLFSMIVAGITVAVMSHGQKSRMVANGNTYMNREELKIHKQSDVFLRRTTVKHKIESSSGSGGGGGGSFHTSSGGHSHGGGGHSF